MLSTPKDKTATRSIFVNDRARDGEPIRELGVLRSNLTEPCHPELVTSIDPSKAGLDSAEAARRLAQYGPNDPAPKKHRSHVVELLLQFANPLVAILLFASIVSAFVGELVNATIIIVIVSLSVAVNFVQTFRSQQAADRLSNGCADGNGLA